MTRLPAPPRRPCVRSTAADDRGTRFRLTLTDRGVAMRPLRSRKPETEVFVSWAIIYDREMLALLRQRLSERECARRRTTRRGRMTRS